MSGGTSGPGSQGIIQHFHVKRAYATLSQPCTVSPSAKQLFSSLGGKLGLFCRCGSYWGDKRESRPCSWWFQCRDLLKRRHRLRRGLPALAANVVLWRHLFPKRGKTPVKKVDIFHAGSEPSPLPSPANKKTSDFSSSRQEEKRLITLGAFQARCASMRVGRRGRAAPRNQKQCLVATGKKKQNS